MIKIYVITADGQRWASRHDKRSAIDEAMCLSKLYPDVEWKVFFTVYENIEEAIFDNVMICPECNELMQHEIVRYKGVLNI